MGRCAKRNAVRSTAVRRAAVRRTLPVFLFVFFGVAVPLEAAAPLEVAVPLEAAAPPVVVERLIAVVDGEILFLSDLRREAALFSSPDDSSGLTDRRERLIDLHLLLAEARRFVPEGPTLQAVEAKASGIRARLVTHFQKTLQGLGLDNEGFMALVRERAWIDRLIEERVRAFTFVSPKSVEVYRQASKEGGVPDAEEIRRILTERMIVEKERDILLRLRKQATLQIDESAGGYAASGQE
jgi:hypothetical protein